MTNLPIQGLNIVFTGNGKGKTTAAMGVALRASGHDLSVGVIRFLKSPEGVYGEAITALRLNIPFQTLGKGFVRKPADQTEDCQAAMNAWNEAQRWIGSRQYDVLILDEITYLFHFDWLGVNEFIAWVKQNKPSSMHLVMTGRQAPAELMDFADLVTEMREIKHPYRQQGLPAQAGVDY